MANANSVADMLALANNIVAEAPEAVTFTPSYRDYPEFGFATLANAAEVVGSKGGTLVFMPIDMHPQKEAVRLAEIAKGKRFSTFKEQEATEENSFWVLEHGVTAFKSSGVEQHSILPDGTKLPVLIRMYGEVNIRGQRHEVAADAVSKERAAAVHAMLTRSGMRLPVGLPSLPAESESVAEEELPLAEEVFNG